MKKIITILMAISLVGGAIYYIKMNTIKEYGIVILLEGDCKDRAIEYNNELASTLLELENVPNEYHVTLYHGAFKEGDLQEIKNKLLNMEMPDIDLFFTEFKGTQDRWIDWMVENNPALQGFHEKVVSTFSPYHKRMLGRIEQVYNTLDQDRKDQADKYGVAGILNLYNPHVTLFYHDKASEQISTAAEDFAREHNPEGYCKVEKIALGELGFNGNIKEIVAFVKTTMD